MVSENAAANKFNAQANAQIAQRSQQAPSQASGNAAVRADIERARGNTPALGQAAAPEAGQGQAAVRADIQKARDSQPTQQGQQPSRETGRGR